MTPNIRPVRSISAFAIVALAVTGIMSVTGCVVTMPNSLANDGDETARNEKIIRDTFETWTQGTYVFLDLLAPDVKWTIHGSDPVAGTYTDIDAFMNEASLPLISRLATPLKPDVHGIWASGETVIIRFDASATTASGARYRNQFVWIFRMHSGLVAEAEAFLDLRAYRQVIDNEELQNQSSSSGTEPP